MEVLDLLSHLPSVNVLAKYCFRSTTFHFKKHCLFSFHPISLLLPPLSLPKTTPKESLVLALEAMELHPELWPRYFDDFLLHKLRLGGLHGGGISQQILNVIFEQLHQRDALMRVVLLHCYFYVFPLDLAKMASLLRSLNQMQQVGGCLLVRTEQTKLVGYLSIIPYKLKFEFVTVLHVDV